MYNQQYRPQSFSILPTVVKNLLIINGLFYLATVGLESQIDLVTILGLHYPSSPDFRPYQIITYMFMHGSFFHLFFNMFALWMFGNILENYWGSKRFLIYYMITGIGAVIIQFAVAYFRLIPLYEQVPSDMLHKLITEGSELIKTNRNYIDPIAAQINSIVNAPMIGASGAVFGILLAFGMLFPNTLLYIYFAIPIKAKWFVILYGGFELYSGIANSAGDDVAHFAHLGGMLFGFILIKYWQKKSNHFY
jgi:membrane associated rhomboid family serine protease